MTKIIALPVEGASALTRYFPETDGATTRRMTLNQVLALFQSNGMAFSGTLSTSSAFSATGGGTLTGTFRPVADDGATLGDATHGFADYFGANGHVFKFNNAYTLTHSTGLLTASGGFTVQGAFTSLGIDDNATGERVEIADTITKFGVSGASYVLSQVAADQSLIIDGGNSGSQGANVILYGGTHASLAYDINYRRGSTNVYYWDDSANTHTFYNNAGTAFNILHSGTNVFLPDSRFGQNTSSAPGVGNATAGVCLTTTISYFSSSGQAMAINHTSSGNMVGFYLAGANQGFISGAGTTITYGAFMGSHIGQMFGSVADIDRLRRGSIVKTVDAMSEWIGFRYVDHDGNVAFNETDKIPDGLKIGDRFEFSYERSVPQEITHSEDVWTVETEEKDEPYTDYEIVDGNAVAINRKRKKRVPIYDEYKVTDKHGKPVMEDVPLYDDMGNPIMVEAPKKRKGTLIPKTERRQKTVQVVRRVLVKQERKETVQVVVKETVQATVVILENDTLVKWELTTERGCERPYGVIAWQDDKESQDWLISGLGAYVVRIKAGVKVKGGDLIQSSDVEGCGEPITEEMNYTALQLRKRHVATVHANIPQPIYSGGPLYYDDGSYIVPASIHCS